MTEPINSGPTPLSQFPVQGGVDPFESDIFFDDGQLPPDPLLDSGAFIEEEKVMQTNLESESAAAAETTITATATATATADDVVVVDVTPLSRRPAKKLPDEQVERPDWLPEDWKIEVKVRTSGATAGIADRANVDDRAVLLQQPTIGPIARKIFERPEWLPEDWGFEAKPRPCGNITDKYYFSPSGARLRSKKEVLHFLETGSKVKKRKQKTEDGASASDNPSGRKQKKPKADVRNFSDLKGFNFNTAPQSVEYISTGEGDFDASVDNKTLPESKKAEWDRVFSHLTQLDSSTGAA